MRVSVVAGLIVGVHVAVIGSVVMTQGCASTQRGAGSTEPALVESAPAPVLPPSVAVVSQPAVQPVQFPALLPPVEPAPLKTSVAAENVYVVKSGDSLSKIAAAHGVSSRELAELNQISDPNKVRIGQKLILPDHSKPSQSQPGAKSAPAAKAAEKSAPVSGDAYVVKAGDALSKIAALHGVKTKDLMAANNITDANKIRVGQKLAIPGAKAAAKSEPAKTEAKPAEQPKVEEAKVEAPVAEAAVSAPVPAAVPAVEAVPAVVPAPEAAVTPPAPEGQEAMLDYTVQDGDTAEGIARLFVVRKDDILRVNNIPAGGDVKPGQQIKIPPSSL
jgi:LysM repeat protein